MTNRNIRCGRRMSGCRTIDETRSKEFRFEEIRVCPVCFIYGQTLGASQHMDFYSESPFIRRLTPYSVALRHHRPLSTPVQFCPPRADRSCQPFSVYSAWDIARSRLGAVRKECIRRMQVVVRSLRDEPDGREIRTAAPISQPLYVPLTYPHNRRPFPSHSSSPSSPSSPPSRSLRYSPCQPLHSASRCPPPTNPPCTWPSPSHAPEGPAQGSWTRSVHPSDFASG